MRARAILTSDMRMLHAADVKSANAVGSQANAQPGEAQLEVQNDVQPPDSSTVDLSIAKSTSSSPEISLVEGAQRAEGTDKQLAPVDEKSTANIQPKQEASLDQVPTDAVPDHGKQQSNDEIRTEPTTAATIASKDEEQSSTQPPGEQPPASAGPTQPETELAAEPAAEDLTKDDLAEPSPGNDFSSLLPGLDTYANDANMESMGGMENFNDMNNDNAFDMDHSMEGNTDPFGNSDDMNQFTGDFSIDDMISYDASNTAGESGQGDNGGGVSSVGGQAGLDVFDDDFFNMSGN